MIVRVASLTRRAETSLSSGSFRCLSGSTERATGEGGELGQTPVQLQPPPPC